MVGVHCLCLTPKPTNSSMMPMPSGPMPIAPPPPLSSKPTTTKVLESLLPLPEGHKDLPLQFKEKVLCLEILGVDSGRALSLNPSLSTAPLHSIHSVLSYLRSKGIHHNDLPKILGMYPSILTSDVSLHLSPVFRFLSHDLRVPSTHLRRPVTKCPRLLISSVRDQLTPALGFLKRLGFNDTQALAYHDPVLLVSSVEGTLIPKLECLVGFGFTREDAVGMVVRCPGLFTFSVDRNLRPKFAYYVDEMGGGLEELRAFPQYFSFSLDKRIIPRHRQAVDARLQLPLPLLLKSTDYQFTNLLQTHAPHNL